MACGCNTTKYLQEGEKLVNKNKIVIESDEKIKNRSSLQYELASYIKQVPNGKFLGIFRTRLWFYYKNQSPSDTTKWDNWVKRVVAEPPVIHNEKLTKSTADAMKSYMQHKGYFNAIVEHETKVKGKFAKNTFTVYPRKQYVYDSISYVSDDTLIQRILTDMLEDSYFKKGAAVDVNVYNNEVNRIVRQMRNLGYLDFTKNYISPLAIDTVNYKVDATLQVFSPSLETSHSKYKIGKVYVYPNYYPEYDALYEADTVMNGVTYMSVTPPDGVPPEIRYPVLKRNIKLIAGELYEFDNELETKKRLASLGIYKFISIKTVKRNAEKKLVDFKILLPSKKKQLLGTDLEFNTANNTVQDNTSIGTALSLNYENKNLFQGAEILSTNLQGGVEFAINDPNRIINTVDVSATAELNIPKFVDYMGIFHLMKKIKVIKKSKLEKLEETATTRIKIGYNYVDVRGSYNYHSLESSFGYTMKPNERWRVKFTQTGLTYFNPTTEDPQLISNEFLRNSFDKQLFTGLFLRDVQASYTGRPRKPNAAWSTRLFGEISGLEVLSLNKIISPNKEWQLLDSIQYANYIKLEIEQRHVKTLSPRKAFAFRTNVGIALPYGPFSQVVPYVKQYYVGGPNSIRAWSVRQIGPGGFFEEESNTSPFYQTGDLRMEMNMEYRFDMFWLIEGAIFLDVGNVWLLKKDEARPNANISKDFWKQFAMGTGFGFRFDFSYFILRFDLGYPLRNHYLNTETNSYWKYQSLNELRFNDINFNLAIGYPFNIF